MHLSGLARNRQTDVRPLHNIPQRLLTYSIIVTVSKLSGMTGVIPV